MNVSAIYGANFRILLTSWSPETKTSRGSSETEVDPRRGLEKVEKVASGAARAVLSIFQWMIHRQFIDIDNS